MSWPRVKRGCCEAAGTGSIMGSVGGCGSSSPHPLLTRAKAHPCYIACGVFGGGGQGRRGRGAREGWEEVQLDPESRGSIGELPAELQTEQPSWKLAPSTPD